MESGGPLKDLVQFLKERRGESGIVYCHKVSNRVESEGFHSPNTRHTPANCVHETRTIHQMTDRQPRFTHSGPVNRAAETDRCDLGQLPGGVGVRGGGRGGHFESANSGFHEILSFRLSLVTVHLCNRSIHSFFYFCGGSEGNIREAG